MIQREATYKKTGEYTFEIAYGITSRTSEQAKPERVLVANRGHWTIENGCHYIVDWNYDEDRSRIRTGSGPENITRLRRLAIGIIKPKVFAVSLRKCGSSHKMYGLSSTISE